MAKFTKANKGSVTPSSSKNEEKPKQQNTNKPIEKQPNKQIEETLEAGENWKKALKDSNEPLFERASRLYQEFVQKELQKYKLAKADEAWMKKIMTEGTLKDKISALSIYIRDNPKATLQAIENMMRFANSKSKKDVIQCYNALKGIFLESVMPKEELKTFMQSTKGKQQLSDKELIEVFFQHKLKELFYRYVNSLVDQLNDNLFFYRKAMLDLLIEIVQKRNECQEIILAALLNKLGDQDKKVVTMLNQHLGKILYKKSDLVLPLVKEIERFIFRPNIKLSSQFYAINFLNTINFSTAGSEVLKEVIKLLFILFKKMIDSKEEDLLASKILSQILRGINKIFPHTKKNFEQFKEFFSEKIEELFKLIHQTKSIKIRIQTLLFIFQVENTENQLTDRYYRVLYEILVDPDVSHSSQTELFFDLLYFSLKADAELVRVKSFIKRLLQHAIHCEPPFIITSLIFLGKMLIAQPGLKTMIQQSERFFDDQEEQFKDAEDSDEEPQPIKANPKQEIIEKSDENQTFAKTQKDYLGYDAFKREPRYSGCGESCLWELCILLKHNHPTIKKFTDALLTQQKPNVDYKGNPLMDFTIANFLDRFSFKNAKKKDSVGMKSLRAKGKVRMSRLEAALQVDDVMKMDQRSVREEEKFFLRFFQQKHKKREGIEKKEKKIKNDEDIDLEGDEHEIDEFADKLAEEQLDKDFYDDDDGDDDDNLSISMDSQVNEEEDLEGNESFDENQGENDDLDEGEEDDFLQNESENEVEGNTDDEQEDEEEFDDEDLGDVEELEDDLAMDEEDMGMGGSDYEEDDIDDFGAILEKAGQEDDFDDRKKFGKSKDQKSNKKQIPKQETPKTDKKPRHSKTNLPPKQKKGISKKAKNTKTKGNGKGKGKKGNSKGKKGKK